MFKFKATAHPPKPRYMDTPEPIRNQIETGEIHDTLYDFFSEEKTFDPESSLCGDLLAILSNPATNNIFLKKEISMRKLDANYFTKNIFGTENPKKSLQEFTEKHKKAITNYHNFISALDLTYRRACSQNKAFTTKNIEDLLKAHGAKFPPETPLEEATLQEEVLSYGLPRPGAILAAGNITESASTNAVTGTTEALDTNAAIDLTESLDTHQAPTNNTSAPTSRKESISPCSNLIATSAKTAQSTPHNAEEISIEQPASAPAVWYKRRAFWVTAATVTLVVLAAAASVVAVAATHGAATPAVVAGWWAAIKGGSLAAIGIGIGGTAIAVNAVGLTSMAAGRTAVAIADKAHAPQTAPTPHKTKNCLSWLCGSKKIAPEPEPAPEIPL